MERRVFRIGIDLITIPTTDLFNLSYNGSSTWSRTPFHRLWNTHTPADDRFFRVPVDRSDTAVALKMPPAKEYVSLLHKMGKNIKSFPG